jgi:hypothetical protein
MITPDSFTRQVKIMMKKVKVYLPIENLTDNDGFFKLYVCLLRTYMQITEREAKRESDTSSKIELRLNGENK